MRTTSAAAVLGVLVLGAVSAKADDSGKVGLFGGYSFTRSDGQTYHGWNGTLTYRLGTRLGLDADLSGHYASIDSSDTSLFTYAAGPRYQLLQGKTGVFLHALAGRTRAKASVAPISGVEISVSQTSTAVLLGGGLDWSLGTHWGVRLQGDYFGVDGDPDWQSQPRASVGLTYRFSGK